MIRLLIAIVWAFLLVGCVTNNAVRQLGEKENIAFQALDKRLSENEVFMQKTVTSLGALGAGYAKKEFELELALTKAKRLESMRAPWTLTRDKLAATQRAVILYHLYEVEVAEQKVLDARVAQRQASAQELLAAYKQLSVLLRGASSHLEVVLAHLNQPTSARIRAFTATFLSDVTAFRETLQASENPRLQQLAERVSHYESQVSQAKDQAENALDSILK